MEVSVTPPSVARRSPTGEDLGALRRLTANTIRGLAMDAVQKANSGHPGMPMGMADVAVVLWTKFLKHNPADPSWPDRDRFVLSAGHGSMLLYALLHLSGYDLPMDELQSFRQWGSRTPGHPEFRVTAGVETTTGPLGQGLANAVGLAIAERWLGERFNRLDFKLVDHYTYVIASDGDLMEGISHEACSLAGHLGLGKLIVLYDDNHISIDGPTSLAFSENVPERFDAYGWHTQSIDGHDFGAVESAINAARQTGKPSLIACRTHIGFGSPNRQDSAKAHGEALGADEVRLSKEKLGLPADREFYVPEEAAEWMRASGDSGGSLQAAWTELLERYKQTFPEAGATFLRDSDGGLAEGWDKDLPEFPAGKAVATRAASGAVLDKLASRIPALLGGSADLTGSNNTLPKGEQFLKPEDFSGRYIHFGVREHSMGGILNGLALHGGVRPYGGTFLMFSDYMRPSIRLAALMELPVIYVFTHDSIGLGEDGPTHQPIEHLTSLRAIPNLAVFRPADAAETVAAWRFALQRRTGPTALVLTRQTLPVFDRTKMASASEAERGGYVLSDTHDPQVILIGTGSETQIAVGAQEILAGEGVRARVVSMPCWEAFDEQSADYRNRVLPRTIRARIAVEAGATLAWSRYVGIEGGIVGLDRFGASAPYQVLCDKLGLTARAVADAARQVLSRQ